MPQPMPRHLITLSKWAIAVGALSASAAWAGPRCYVGFQTAYGLSASFANLDMVIGCADGRLNANGMNRGLETQLVLGPNRVQLRAGVLAGGLKNTLSLGGGFDFATQRWLGTVGVQGDGMRGFLEHQFGGDTSLGLMGNTLSRQGSAASPAPAPVPAPFPATPPRVEAPPSPPVRPRIAF